MESETKILIFLGFAVAIIVLALLVPRFFSRSIESDKRHYDANADRRNGKSTWIGVDEADGKNNFLDD